VTETAPCPCGGCGLKDNKQGDRQFERLMRERLSGHNVLQGTRLMLSDSRWIIIMRIRRVNPTDGGGTSEAEMNGLTISRVIVRRTWQVAGPRVLIGRIARDGRGF
jgi:hypothetical protein